MRRFALLALLCAAVSGTALAQQDMGNLKTAGSTYTTGVVEANAADSITIREDSDRVVTVLFDEGTVGAPGHAVGSRVRINFHLNEANQAVADEIQGVTTDSYDVVEATVISEPVLPSGPPIEEPAIAETAPEVEPAVTAEPAAEPAPEPAYREALPATGSQLYGLALLGLVSLSTATLLRVAR